MQCEHCGTILKEAEFFRFGGQVLCDDCYMEASHPPKVCDPTAVASALSTRKQLGQTGTEGLTDLQTKIYQAIEQKGKVTKTDLASLVGVSVDVLEREFAVLRHCELVRAFKEGSAVYLTKW